MTLGLPDDRYSLSAQYQLSLRNHKWKSHVQCVVSAEARNATAVVLCQHGIPESVSRKFAIGDRPDFTYHGSEWYSIQLDVELTDEECVALKQLGEQITTRLQHELFGTE